MGKECSEVVADKLANITVPLAWSLPDTAVLCSAETPESWPWPAALAAVQSICPFSQSFPQSAMPQSATQHLFSGPVRQEGGLVNWGDCPGIVDSVARKPQLLQPIR